MVAGIIPASDLAIDAAFDQPRDEIRADKQVVEAQTIVALITTSPIGPKAIEPLVRTQISKAVRPTLLDNASKCTATLWLDQCIAIP